jgi:hypothetical protein
MSTAMKAGCGCGSGSPTVASGKPDCGCGGTCQSCQGASLQRPQFFPGQLLTEDDLGQLVSYTVAKSRLHNRFLWGDGVVCGLQVTCDPCGGGNVTVNAGYALDCCGSDVVVPCAVSLDVNAMIRDLRARQGADCGDPCNPGGDGGASAASGARTALTGPAGGKDGKDRCYDLLVRYCEEQVEPVASYTNDDPCAQQECQFSRVQEGYAFELRCPGDEPGHPGVLDAIGACLAPLVRDASLETAASMTATVAERLDKALARYAAAERAKRFDFGAEDVARAKALAGADPPRLPLAEFTADVEEAASLALRWRLAKAAAPAPGADAESVAALERSLGGDKGWIAQLRAAAGAPGATPLEAVAARETATAAETFLRREERPPEVRAVEGGAFAMRMLASGKALTLELVRAYDQGVSALCEKLACLPPPKGDCRLPRDCCASDSGTTTSAERLDEKTAKALLHRLEGVEACYLRYVRDCLCYAGLPPCQPCDDPAILLARVTVRDCEVTEICNIVRRIVLSPAALQYWLGFAFDAIRGSLERCCCGADGCAHAAPATKRSRAEAIALRYWDAFLGSCVAPAKERVGPFARLGLFQEPVALAGRMEAPFGPARVAARLGELLGRAAKPVRAAAEREETPAPAQAKEPEAAADVAGPPPKAAPRGQRPRPRGGGRHA